MLYWEKQRKIKSLYELYSRPVREKYSLTQMEYSILLFLHRNPGYDTASSIIQTSQYTKSHVSSAIKNLEKRNLVKREFAHNNKKTIHLRLTDQTQEILQDSMLAYKQYRDCLFAGFSEEDFNQIRHAFNRICKNAEAKLQEMEEGKKNA